MDELNKLRDEMAEAIEALGLSNANAPEFFRNGWNEALKTLSEAAGEFDAKSEWTAGTHAYGALEKNHPEENMHNRVADFVAGARWQFDQMSARVGLTEHWLNEYRKSIKDYEARLSESERDENEFIKLRTYVTQLEADCAAKESNKQRAYRMNEELQARRKELEFELAELHEKNLYRMPGDE